MWQVIEDNGGPLIDDVTSAREAGDGVIVRTHYRCHDSAAESLVFIPDAKLQDNKIVRRTNNRGRGGGM